jgi:hypothetical protein
MPDRGVLPTGIIALLPLSGAPQPANVYTKTISTVLRIAFAITASFQSPGLPANNKVLPTAGTSLPVRQAGFGRQKQINPISSPTSTPKFKKLSTTIQQIAP